MKIKYTHDEFKKLVADANPGVEIIGTFTGVTKHILCKCKLCNKEYEPLANSLIKNSGDSGCGMCRSIKNGFYTRKTKEQFLSELDEKYLGSISLISEYEKTHSPATFRCNNCLYEWTVSEARNIFNNVGCPVCNHGLIYRSHEEFKAQVESFGHVTVLGHLNKMGEKVHVRCNYCGKEFDTIAMNLVNGSMCDSCSRRLRGINRRLSQDEFEQKAAQQNPNIKIIGKYNGYLESIKCICLRCGDEFETTPDLILKSSGRGCARCSMEIRNDLAAKDHDTFIFELKAIQPYIKILGTYRRAHEKIECQCTECGEIWMQEPTLLLRGYGCPKCKMSMGEKAIMLWLEQRNINYVRTKKFDGLYGSSGRQLVSYDFYLPELKVLIEFQGLQHYEPVSCFGGQERYDRQVINDKIKKEYATSHGYRLIEIRYDEDVFEKLNTVLNLESVTTTGAA